MRPLLFVALLCMPRILQAQDATLVPGFRSTLASATDDTLRAALLADLCFNLMREAPDSAQWYGERARKLAQHIGDARATTRANHYLGLLALEQGGAAEAQPLLAAALRASGYAPRSAEQAGLLRSMADVQRALGRAAAAAEHYAEVLSIAQSTGQRSQLPELHQLLAELAVQRSAPSEATYHYHRYNALVDSARYVALEQERNVWQHAMDSISAAHRTTLEQREEAHQRASAAQHRWLLAAGIGGAVLLLITLVLLVRRRQPSPSTPPPAATPLAAVEAPAAVPVKDHPTTELRHLRHLLDPALVQDRLQHAVTLLKEGRHIEALAQLQGTRKMMQHAAVGALHGRVRLEDELAFLRQGVKMLAVGRSDLAFEATADAAALEGDRTLPAMAVWPFLQTLVDGTAPIHQVSIRFSGSATSTTCTIRCEHAPMPAAVCRSVPPFIQAQQQGINDQLGQAFNHRTSELTDDQGKVTGRLVTLVFQLDRTA
jgi:tetratricopeptide (TPR) repeat protein